MASICPLMGGRACLREKCMIFVTDDDPNDDIVKNACAFAIGVGASTSVDPNDDDDPEMVYFDSVEK